jgi:hypothetical protein
MGRTKRKGGTGAANPSSYSSASTYEMQTVGPENVQYNNVFGINGDNNPSNAIRGLQGQIAGKRSKKNYKNRNKRGGLWGQVINQALVPFGLLGLQQIFGKRYTKKNRSFRKKTYKRRY